MKRLLLFLALLLLSVAQLPAQAPPIDPGLGLTTLPLYDTPPPASTPGGTPEMPSLTVFSPQAAHSNHTAVIIAPGGAYQNLVSNLEGRQVADWFVAHGVTAFVLKYRLGEHNLYPVPLEDAQRAIRLVRASAATYALDPHRIGIAGFSAGGHLAAAAGTLFHEAPASPGKTSGDRVNSTSDRPDFVVLGYPWLNAMEPQQAKEITYCSLTHTVTPAQCAAFATAYTPKLHVTAHTPPTFIYATTDDTVVPVRASTEFFDAMMRAGAPVEMHLFHQGGHGSGLGSGDPALDLWPLLLEQWLRAQGLLPPVSDPFPPPHAVTPL